MNPEKLNSWMSLIANIGVLIGIVFLSLEISQSNRIGTNTAENELASISSDLASNRIEYSNLYVKLQNADELSPEEIVQAQSVALKNVVYWAAVESSYRNDLIEKYAYEIYTENIRITFARYPGLRPYFAEIRDNAKYQRGLSGTIDIQLEELEKYGL